MNTHPGPASHTLSSPTFRTFGTPASPLTHKRQRCGVAAAKAVPDTFAGGIPLRSRLNADDTNRAVLESAGMLVSLAKLEKDSHVVRLRQAESEQQDKQTENTYKRAVNSYEKWWLEYQVELLALDASYTPIPAFPVTAAKAVMFLDYETKRPKVNIIINSVNLLLTRLYIASNMWYRRHGCWLDCGQASHLTEDQRTRTLAPQPPPRVQRQPGCTGQAPRRQSNQAYREGFKAQRAEAHC